MLKLVTLVYQGRYLKNVSTTKISTQNITVKRSHRNLKKIKNKNRRNISKQCYWSLEHKEMKRKDVFQYMLGLDGIEHRKYL